KVAGNAPSVPTELSDERLAEADESEFRSLLGELGTAAAVTVGGTLDSITTPPPPRPAPLAVVEHAVQPVPSPENPRPSFPEDARKQGVEGVVILRILVGTSGQVED